MNRNRHWRYWRWAALSMAGDEQPARLEGRLRAILTPDRLRRPLSRRALGLVFVVAALALVPLALLRPVAHARQQASAANESPARTDEDRMTGQTACLSNLKQVGTALMMYVQDYDETFPPLASSAQMQNRLRPYLRNDAAFFCPETRQPYRPTPALGGLRLEALPNPSRLMAIRDAAPHPGLGGPGTVYPNGLWNVAYADGHVKAEGKLPTSWT